MTNVKMSICKYVNKSRCKDIYVYVYIYILCAYVPELGQHTMATTPLCHAYIIAMLVTITDCDSMIYRIIFQYQLL